LATFDLPEQMAALQAMRAELEAALGNDENWRALRRAGAPRSHTQDDRRDRDARLAKALEANPLYVAWTHIGAAIDALRDAEHAADAADAGDDLTRNGSAASALSTRAAEAPWPEAEDEAGEIELPKDIRERIRADAADASDDDASEPPTQPARGDAEPVAPDVSQETSMGRAGRKLVAIPSLEPIAAPTEQAFSDRLQKLEADMDELNEALEAPSRALAESVTRADAAEQSTVEEPAALPVAASTLAKVPDVSNRHPPTVRLADPVEAKVTFVRRKTPASAPAKDSPAAPAGNGFVPLTAPPEEAEVAIVKPEDPNVAPVRRFLKALSGD
jgi:hypothetical protein